MKTYIIDIDDTLLFSAKTNCEKCQRVNYELSGNFQTEIEILNRLKAEGNTIILWTGRGWDCYQLTKDQLKTAGINYDELIMGKPQGIYVDRDALTTLEGL